MRIWQTPSSKLFELPHLRRYNIENIFYWTDNNGAVYLPGDTALTHRTKSDLPRFVAAVYSALNTDSGVSERVVTLNGHCGLLLDVLYDKDWVYLR